MGYKCSNSTSTQIWDIQELDFLDVFCGWGGIHRAARWQASLGKIVINYGVYPYMCTCYIYMEVYIHIYICNIMYTSVCIYTCIYANLEPSMSAKVDGDSGAPVLMWE